MEGRSSQETRLLDFVERIRRQPDSRLALHVHYSRLTESNRQERQLRMASAIFNPQIKRLDAYLFSLSNDDHIFLAKDAKQEDLAEEVAKISQLFAIDPLLAKGGKGELFTWYELPEHTAEFITIVRSIKARADREHLSRIEQEKDNPRGAVKKPLSPLQPANLGRLVEQLASMDITSLIRRQPVCALTDDGKVRPVFNEVFVSIDNLRRTVMPTVDLTASTVLFTYLTQYLDRRILRTLPDVEKAVPLSTSININIETILSPQFLEFDQRLRAVTQKTIVLELQAADLFADFRGFIFARDFVRDRGYRICLDGVTSLTLPLIEKKMLKLDLHKLVWSPNGWDDSEVQRSEMRESIQRVGPTRIIFCRCDDQRAIDFGRSMGVKLFQGRHLDQMLSASVREAQVA